jgi:hypothetical protein
MGITHLPSSFSDHLLPVIFRAFGGHCHADSGGPSGGPPMKKQNKIGLAVVGVIVLIIIGIVDGGGKSTPASSTSPIASASALASAVASPTATATSTPTPSVVATKAKARPKPHKTAAPPTPIRTRSKKAAPPPPPPTTAPAAAPSTPTGCYPRTNGGNCYQPGEYCRNSDHGMSGVAGDGERITCEDNDGWRWEPA